MLRRGSLNRGLLAPGGRRGFTRPSGVQLLLDAYPGAVAAYALTKLRAAYSGSAIRVRRSSDNAEQDIGFSGNALDTASLLSFCGAGDGFVVTWYDQSVAGNSATQSTTGNQPQIVDSGAVVTNGSHNAIEFTKNSSQSLIVGNIQGAGEHSWIYAVFDMTDTVFSGAYQDHLMPQVYTGNTWHWAGVEVSFASSAYTFKPSQGINSSAITSVAPRVLAMGSVRSPSNNAKIYDNGNLILDDSTDVNSMNAFAHVDCAIGGGTGDCMGAYHMAWIVWNSDKSADHSAINSRLMTDYGIS